MIFKGSVEDLGMRKRWERCNSICPVSPCPIGRCLKTDPYPCRHDAGKETTITQEGYCKSCGEKCVSVN